MSLACSQCFLPENTLLLDDYYPVGESYYQAAAPQQQANIRRILLNREGLCPYCELFQRNLDPALLRQELTQFVAAARREKVVVLALSGGKDSLTALYLAKVVLGLNLRCLMYQNGFIPAPVVQQAQKLCDQYQVPLDIVTHPLYAEFKQEYRLEDQALVATTGLDFCALCADHLNTIALQYLQQAQSHWLLLGNKVYARLSPTVSAIKIHQCRDFRYQSVNLLYALNINWERQQQILKLMAWQDPGLAGYTSNCRIPGLVEKARRKRLQMSSDQGYIEAELRSGAYTRLEAQTLLAAQSADDAPDLSFMPN